MDNPNINGHLAERSEVLLKEIEANNWTFTCREVGIPSTDGKAIIYLHGWPETSHMWEDLMYKLYRKGYYGLAPNLRGYSIGARPKAIAEYHVEKLAQDIIALADARGLARFHLVGHDWGSAIGWVLLALIPERILSFSALSVPHVKAFGKAILNDPKQHKRSAYMRMFQWPYLPEWMLLARNKKILHEECWKYCKVAQVKDYLNVLGNFKGLKASINYYRANYKQLTKGLETLDLDEVHTPTLLIWGNKDVAIMRGSVMETEKYMKGPYRLLELEAGHWLIQEKEAEVRLAIEEHIATYSA